MSRFLTTIVVCLALGLITSIGVAWLCARGSNAPGWRVRSVCVLSSATPASGAQQGLIKRCRFGSDLIEVGFSDVPLPHTPTPSWFRPSVALKPQQASGLPFRCLRRVHDWNGGYAGIPGAFMMNIDQGIRINPPSQGNPFIVGTVLPIDPIPLPLAANTAAWGGLWFVLLFPILSRVRRRMRRKRGLCPMCAYDLRGDFASGCPECGSGRAAKASSPSLVA